MDFPGPENKNPIPYLVCFMLQLQNVTAVWAYHLLSIQEKDDSSHSLASSSGKKSTASNNRYGNSYLSSMHEMDDVFEQRGLALLFPEMAKPESESQFPPRYGSVNSGRSVIWRRLV